MPGTVMANFAYSCLDEDLKGDSVSFFCNNLQELEEFFLNPKEVSSFPSECIIEVVFKSLVCEGLVSLIVA